jgi:hypothetical protein
MIEVVGEIGVVSDDYLPSTFSLWAPTPLSSVLYALSDIYMCSNSFSER